MALAAGAGVAATALSSSSACTTTTTVNASLVSGIFINTELLLGDLGCDDKNPEDVYKYVAVVINDSKNVGGAGIFDCFAEGVFANLPGTDAGALDFAVWIYAYNAPDFAAANKDGALASAVATLNGVNRPDGSVVPVPTNSVPDGGTSKGEYPAALSSICRSKATWVSVCSATSQDSVQTLANCGPLTLEKTAPSSCDLPVLIPDGGLSDAARTAHD
jgi:hypothetical protein